MHTFNKNGQRKANVLDKLKTKKEIKLFYNRLNQLDSLAKHLKELNEDITEDNINDIVSPIVGRDLDSMEKMIVLNKLSNG